MKKELALLGLLFLASAVQVCMHFYTRDSNALISPFPFFDFALHPQSYADMYLRRLRVLFLLIFIYIVAKEFRRVTAVLVVFEVIDLVDYFLRYGQDFLTPGFDANGLKLGAAIGAIACHIITLPHAKKELT